MTPVVVIMGASGGLGSAIAREYLAQGARVVLAGRSIERLTRAAAGLSGNYSLLAADMADQASLQQAASQCLAQFGRVDVLVNAVGHDVRRALDAHTDADIEMLVQTNLVSAIWLTRAFLPMLLAQGDGVIVHLGGFADGRLMFPYYTVDAATRAGLRGFVDAVNREIEDSGVTVSYFSPAPADTDAERPYHPIWREMGTAIVPTEQVARAVVRAARRRERVHVMGAAARWFARLNSAAPGLADCLLMRRYGAVLKRHFGQPLR
ncbi:MAG: SDR family NAD(P)-dependent oxidoreductase [Pleurocapsa minor GSE-CHR-MK-17-07R]|jgi:NADP-dependent 3-hydroxy acid dehydrogenase YdfG|nr:SDR family NAD(P)-dependent oxidoreductase [Pleurocapsa minor GSE-CHR-MK 17-07R]